ncbi:aldo/keto reductase [Actinomadura montaniterrae]|uniref:MerR family transcriptional regulator n=1 Tax=Actinomadura montaniterrae TaxID=1803903 RepID=A0A6L3VGB3_9ACTN|nr:aldo/keto reductase [Actinomadura montaniterrae]KAB2362870.1 MerR family transcriptional regulator [Actinomadura montaniterrae]
MKTWSIREAAGKCGLPPDTMRWYEKAGLVGPIERGPDGRRRYTGADIDRLTLLRKLRATGMPIRELRRYADLVRSGAGEPERFDVLRRHRAFVSEALATQREYLRLLDRKIGIYQARAHGTARHGKGAELGGLAVSAQGLGCMGMSEWRGPTDWDSATETIRRAIDLGVTFLDTADVYGAGHNEVLVGRAISGRRERVQLATKFGVDRSAGAGTAVRRGEAGYVKRACEASLLRLGVDVIDLYYLHRPPQTAEIEETVGAMAELVAEGKVRFLGLSAVDGDLLRRAHAVHPIAAVQSEYSLWSRGIEATVLDAMRDLGVGLVPYSPLGRGYLTGTLDSGAEDARRGNPRFGPVAEHAAANRAVIDAVRSLADAKGATPAQVALAWVHAQARRLGVPVVPIPGTKRVARLEENLAALELSLTDDDLAFLGSLAGTGSSAS